MTQANNRSGVTAEMSPAADNDFLALRSSATKDAIRQILDGHLPGYEGLFVNLQDLPEDTPIVLERLKGVQGWECLRVNSYVIFHRALTDDQRHALNRPTPPRQQLADEHIGRIILLTEYLESYSTGHTPSEDQGFLSKLLDFFFK